MGLKKTVENNLIIIIAIVFGTGLSIGWFASIELLVKPRDYEISQLKDGIIIKKGDFSADVKKHITLPTASEDKSKDSDSSPDVKKHITLPTASEDKSKDPDSSPKELNPISIEVVPKVSLETYEKKLQQIRKNKMLRPLIAMESDKNISDIPSGTYFFLSCVYLATDSGPDKIIAHSPADRYNNNKRITFELHINREGSSEIIGFVSETDAARISKLDGFEVKSFSLFPYPWSELSSMVVIPLDRFVSSDYREIELEKDKSIYVLDLKIQ